MKREITVPESEIEVYSSNKLKFCSFYTFLLAN